MTGHNPDRPAWLDRHTLAVDIAANWCGITLLAAGVLTLLLHELARNHNATGPNFWPVLAAVAATRLASWATKQTWQQTLRRRTQP